MIAPNTRKKIGILTYFWGTNPGTFLQAYSIQQAYKETGVDADIEIINYKSFGRFWRPNFSYITPSQWKRDVVRRAKYKDCRKRCMNITKRCLFSKNPYAAWRFIESFDYDLISVGSDTLLELWRADSSGLTPYWLDPTISGRKVMCAASARATQYSDLSDSQKAHLRSSTAAFDLLGARDAATYKLLRDLGGSDEKLRLVPDPTLCFEIDRSHADRYFRNRGIRFDKPTVALHMMRQVGWSFELAEMFKKKGWQVLSVRPADYADYVINDMSPFEWAGLSGFCDLLITHRFHDTMFALKNQTPVLSFVPSLDYVTESQDSKYHSLMNAFGLRETNLIDDWTQTGPAEMLEKGLAAVEHHRSALIREKLSELRQEFQTYARHVVGLLG